MSEWLNQWLPLAGEGLGHDRHPLVVAVTAIFVITGGVVALLAGIGLVRMPDLFTRMQSATKASSLGTACVLIGVAVYYGTAGVVFKAVLVIVFIFLTAPLAAHVIARAAYISGVPLWEESLIDELRTAQMRPPSGGPWETD
jgi:multicomponent Na+:H+ antiporter subunit G